MAMIDDLLPLIAYIAALAAVIWLGARAPDYIQLAALTIIGCAMAVYIVADLGTFNGTKRAWEFRAIGNSYLFWGVMIYLLRQIWIQTGVCKSLK